MGEQRKPDPVCPKCDSPEWFPGAACFACGWEGSTADAYEFMRQERDQERAAREAAEQNLRDVKQGRGLMFCPNGHEVLFGWSPPDHPVCLGARCPECGEWVQTPAAMEQRIAELQERVENATDLLADSDNPDVARKLKRAEAALESVSYTGEKDIGGGRVYEILAEPYEAWKAGRETKEPAE